MLLPPLGSPNLRPKRRDCNCLYNVHLPLPLPKDELRRPGTVSGLLTRALAHSWYLIKACEMNKFPTMILKGNCQALSLGTPHNSTL